MIVINCPYCIAKYKTDESSLGKSLKCKKCDLNFKVSSDNRKKLPFIAQIVLDRNFVNENTLSKIIFYLDRMRLKGSEITMEEILITKGGVSAKKIMEIYNSLPLFDKEYAQISLKKNYATEKDTNKGLKLQITQQNEGKLISLGKFLIEDEVITKRQHNEILMLQNERSDFETVLNFIKNKAQKKTEQNNKNDNSSDVDLCNFILTKKIISKDDLDKALLEIKSINESGRKKSIEEYLIEKKIITKELVELHKKILEFKEIRKKDKSIAENLIRENPKNRKAIENAFKNQLTLFSKKKRIERLKDILANSLKDNQPKSNDIPLVEEEKPVDKTPVEDEIVIVTEPQLIISADNLSAIIDIPEVKSRDIKDMITYEKVERMIIDGLIKYGMADNESIKKQLSTDPFDAKQIVVAKGTPPTPGTDGHIKTYFQKDFLEAGKVNAFGMIDFRDRGEVPQVKEGELLAEKFPPVKGIPGKDVFGQPIAVESVKDEKLQGGTGTYFSDDYLKLYAKVNGQPTLVLRKIEIYESYEVNGDVDYSTGHIKFNGNITISGKILDGFKVKGINVEVGDVEGGSISAEGNVVVKNGIIGGVVITKGSLTANYVSDSRLDVLENVIINKQLIDSKVSTSGSLIIEHGQISNCQIVARKGVTAKEIGTNHSKPCRIGVGIVDHIQKEMHRLKKVILDSKEKYEQSINDIKDFKDDLKTYHTDIIALTKKQNKNLDDQKEAVQNINLYKQSGQKDKLVTQEAILNTCSDKIKKMDQRIKGLLKAQDKPLIKIAEMSKPIGEYKMLLDKSQKELAEFEQWESENPGVAVVNVGSHLNEGTYIKGTNSEITIKKNRTKCVVEEIQLDKTEEKDSMDENIEVLMEMVIDDKIKK